jgi:16S rRNA (guanine966-N2)-methyltransferase
VRSAIFDRLQAEVVDAEVLDLFAGSGALAIEALSRGAARAVLVEQQAALIRFLDEQLRRLGLRERCELVHDDARRYLARAATQQHARRFGLVLLDPPYADVALHGDTLAGLVASGLLAAEAVVVLELPRHRGRLPAIVVPRELAVEAVRDHGQTALEFLRAIPSPESPDLNESSSQT